MSKQMGKKLILISAALLLIALVLIRAVLIHDTPSEEKPGTLPETPLVGERITRAEALRLFSFFFYTDSQRAGLDRVITFSDTDESKWYDSYVNAAVQAGYLSNAGGKVRAEETLSCGEFKDLLVRISALCSISYADLVQKLPVRLQHAKVKDDLLLSEFLYFYRLCMEVCKQQEHEGARVLPVERTSLYVLQVTENEAGASRFVTENEMEYKAGQFQDYSDLFSETGTTGNRTSRDIYRNYPKAGDYLDCRLEVLYCGKEIIFITGMSEEPVTLSNVWVIRAKDSAVHAFVDGYEREFTTEFPLEAQVYESICDLTVTGRRISQITVKPDTITGKVLLTGTEGIELEGYGQLPLDENYQIYKLYDELQLEHTSSILVGYDNVTFVVSEGKICAALIREQIKAENIRVLISVDNTVNYSHEKVVFTSDRAFTVACQDEIKEYPAGEVITISYEDMLPTSPRITVQPVSETGRIQILSIRRNYGSPKYRGILEIAPAEKGLLVINELSIEEYLYAVVPSEMPTSYGEDALKVQAVCARSYCYMQLLANRYSKYGAHVDDTVNCQVYNNVAENNSSIFAVKDTYGKVMEHNGKIVTAYYFSTSCGYTSFIEDVWEENRATEYFTGELQADPASVKRLQEAAAQLGAELDEDTIKGACDLSVEEDFQAFIDGGVVRIPVEGGEVRERISTFDSSFSWYRWNVTMDAATLSEQIDATIGRRYRVNPADVLTMTSKKGSYVTASGTTVKGKFESYAVETVGTVQEIRVLTRAKSGIITELLVVGTANTVILRNQTNVRTLLAPVDTTIYLANQVTMDGFSLMPSAYFYVEAETTKKGTTQFTFYGGGYGHGVGMSQNGVKNLIAEGYGYEEVLKHYYRGINIGFIY